MRAKRTLAAVFVLFGTVSAASIVEAAPRDAWQLHAAVTPQINPVPQRQVAHPSVRTAITVPALAIGAGTPILPVAHATGLSCVPFARMATGLDIRGDARLWWNEADGRYLRGQRPERGAVMAFMASGGMRRGHVAVVSRVVDDRTVLIDHSNWAGPGIRRGTVMRGVLVVDVSDRNDWTAVRVQVGHDRAALGRTYPVHGFIYNRPLGAPPGERILTASAPGTASQEVAEAPSPHAALHMQLAEALAE
jgi:hypothetical protein